jgi:hypothetical protein
MNIIDGTDYAPVRNDGGTNRVTAVISVDLSDANALMGVQMEGKSFGHAGPGHMLATAVAEAIANASWPTGVDFRGVTATLDGYSATR